MKTKLHPLIGEAAKLLLPIILGYLGGYIAFSRQNNVNELDRLNDKSDKIIDIEMQYPYVIDSIYIKSWSKHQNAVDDSSMRYTSYCEYLFGYIENVMEYNNLDKKKVDDYMDVKWAIGLHKAYWNMPYQQDPNNYPSKGEFDLINSYMK